MPARNRIPHHLTAAQPASAAMPRILFDENAVIKPATRHTTSVAVPPAGARIPMRIQFAEDFRDAALGSAASKF